MSKTDVRTRKARFLWLKQELGQPSAQIAGMLGKAKSTVVAWGADSRPDSAPTEKAIEDLKNRLLGDAKYEARVANHQLSRLEKAFADGGCLEISRV